MAEKFHLTPGECNNDTWRRLKAHYEQRLAFERQKVENLGLDERERMQRLVRIDEIKKFLSLGESGEERAANAG